jgi:hypothetical protein
MCSVEERGWGGGFAIMKREPKKFSRKRCFVPKPWIVSSLIAASPSAFIFIDCWKYDMTANRLGAVAGMKRRKSLSPWSVSEWNQVEPVRDGILRKS